MLISIITAFLLFTSVLAAPRPQPVIYKQTNRRAVSRRLTDRANGIARRQAPSPKVYRTCENSLIQPGQGGVVFASLNGGVGVSGGETYSTLQGLTPAACIDNCASSTSPGYCTHSISIGTTCYLNRGTVTDVYQGVFSAEYFNGRDCAAIISAYPGEESASAFADGQPFPPSTAATTMPYRRRRARRKTASVRRRGVYCCQSSSLLRIMAAYGGSLVDN